MITLLHVYILRRYKLTLAWGAKKLPQAFFILFFFYTYTLFFYTYTLFATFESPSMKK